MEHPGSLPNNPNIHQPGKVEQLQYENALLNQRITAKKQECVIHVLFCSRTGESFLKTADLLRYLEANKAAVKSIETQEFIRDLIFKLESL